VGEYNSVAEGRVTEITCPYVAWLSVAKIPLMSLGEVVPPTFTAKIGNGTRIRARKSMHGVMKDILKGFFIDCHKNYLSAQE
jgi:hypothetical protein